MAILLLGRESRLCHAVYIIIDSSTMADDRDTIARVYPYREKKSWSAYFNLVCGVNDLGQLASHTSESHPAAAAAARPGGGPTGSRQPRVDTGTRRRRRAGFGKPAFKPTDMSAMVRTMLWLIFPRQAEVTLHGKELIQIHYDYYVIRRGTTLREAGIPDLCLAVTPRAGR